MRRFVLGLVLGLALMATEAAAQWETLRSVDDFTDETKITVRGSGENRTLMLTVGCYPNGGVLVQVTDVAALRRRSLSLSSIFPSDVEARWDGGEVERLGFSLGSGDEEAFVQKLAEHQELRMRAGVLATDSFDLNGAAGELVNLECTR